jgi:SNF2 family DNA or RNA helicase
MRKLKSPPSMMKPDVEYYDHQIEGVRRLGTRSMILADEMGLGKSLQALAVSAALRDKGYGRILIVATLTLKANWEEEIARFTNFTFATLTGTPARREKILNTFDKDVLIAHYDQIVKHWEKLNDLGFDIVIFDEAHLIKNRSSKRGKSALKLQARRFIPVTGSPLLNNVDELWTLLNRVDPDEFPNYWKYRNRYCHFGGFQGKQIVGVKREAELNRKLGDVMLRRLKAECTDLPEKQFIKVYCDLTPTQKALYDEAVKERQITLPADPNPMEVENALTRILRLKQICGSSGTIPGYDDESGKLDELEERVQEIIDSGEPTVIFTQFRGVQQFIDERLQRRHIPTWVLNGDVPHGDRVKVVHDWQDNARAGNHGAIVCMYQVAGVGLNMTAASTVHLVDKLYVPGLNDQAVDRVHRIGVDKTRPVRIWEYITRRTYEAKIEKILENKQEIFGVVVEGAEWKRKLVEALATEEVGS